MCYTLYHESFERLYWFQRSTESSRIEMKMLCSIVKEPTEPVEVAMKRLEARWVNVTAGVVAGKESVTASNAVVQFSAELDCLMNTISVYDTWASSEATNVAKDFVQLSQQLEQCRVCSH